jgi:hypothetical protein
MSEGTLNKKDFFLVRNSSSHMYVDAKAMVYEMQSVVSSSSNLINSSSGQVKVS